MTVGGILALLCGIVAVVRRKHAIGGWLLYFFFQVLLGLALVAATTHWKLYASREWSDPVRYFLFTVSNLARGDARGHRSDVRIARRNA